MRKYNLIVVLGYGFVGKWQLSEHVKLRLREALELYRKGAAKKIAVCGKWSLAWDQQHITPPTTEAEEMKKALVNLGVPAKDVLKEEFSKDTVGNAFYLKTKIMENYGYKRILVLCADYVLERVKYIFYKVFEPSYSVVIIPTPTPYKNDKEVLQAQQEILKLQKKFLKKMKRGDNAFLQSRLYKDPYYQQKVPEKVTFVALGGKK